MILGIDCATKLTEEKAAGIKKAGYDFAGRYMVPQRGSLAAKALSKNECRIITAAGLKILSIWETTADRVKGGADAGAADGAEALALAREYGMPESGAVYFCVDYDARSKDYNAIEAYLRAAKAAIGEYRIGVYGSYRVIEEMHSRGAADVFWQCVAWSYGQKSTHRSIYQALWGQTVAGVSVDINECADLKAAGIWDYSKEDDMTVERFRELWLEMRKEYLQNNACGDWSAEDREWAISTGLFAGNGETIDGEPNYMWQDPVTREQLAAVMHRNAERTGQA